MGDATTYELEEIGNIRDRLLHYSEVVKANEEKRKKDEAKKKDKEE